MKKLVVFDLDGTLADTISSLKYSGDLALGKFGFGPFSATQYKYFVGDGAANLVRRALVAGGDVNLDFFERALAEYRRVFAANCMYKVAPYAGVPELLGELRSRGVKCAVLSNKPHGQTLAVVESLFDKGVFDIVLGQVEGVAIKPSPEGVFKILKEFSVMAADALYIGDTATDMKTGKAAGIFTLGALWGFRGRDELVAGGADALLSHPRDLMDYL